jgi:hypothetical protein
MPALWLRPLDEAVQDRGGCLSREWSRLKAKRDDDFDMLLERRDIAHRVYLWHVRFWAADPRHPSHAYALDLLGIQPDLFPDLA